MELLNLDCLGQSLRLEASTGGWQALFWNNQLVSQVETSVEGQRHEFHLQAGERLVHCRIEVELQWQPFKLNYQLFIDDELVTQGSRTTRDIERQPPSLRAQPKQALSWVGLASLGFKLLKSAKVIKVVLAGASLAAYSWLFSLQFALSLIACLVIHEYGHIRAMHYFGMRTKGIYLIPFVGGLALGSERVNTRWQTVAIAMMGPCFGLLMSIACLLAYWVSGEMFFGGLAAFSALLNLFNLLPILPLDGGHVLKSISFSMNSLLGISTCAIAAGVGVYLCYHFDLALLGFLLLIGSVEILFEWRARHQQALLPLDRYGQIFSALWYVLTVAGLVSVIVYFAGTGDAILGLPLKVLQT